MQRDLSQDTQLVRIKVGLGLWLPGPSLSLSVPGKLDPSRFCVTSPHWRGAVLGAEPAGRCGSWMQPQLLMLEMKEVGWASPKPGRPASSANMNLYFVIFSFCLI